MDAWRPRRRRVVTASLHARRAETLIGIGRLRDATRDLRELIIVLGGGAAPPVVAFERFRRIRRQASIAADEPCLWRRAQHRIEAGAPPGFSLRPVGDRRRSQARLTIPRAGASPAESEFFIRAGDCAIIASRGDAMAL